jgi:hypothetical protein
MRRQLDAFGAVALVATLVLTGLLGLVLYDTFVAEKFWLRKSEYR